MKRWRWYIVLLLSVFAYRILVHAPLSTYAQEHGIAGQLFNKENNWSQFVFKTRKRSMPPQPTAHEASLVTASTGRENGKLFLLPLLTTVFHFTLANDTHLYAWPLPSAPPRWAGKTFLKLCCLRR